MGDKCLVGFPEAAGVHLQEIRIFPVRSGTSYVHSFLKNTHTKVIFLCKLQNTQLLYGILYTLCQKQVPLNTMGLTFEYTHIGLWCQFSSSSFFIILLKVNQHPK